MLIGRFLTHYFLNENMKKETIYDIVTILFLIGGVYFLLDNNYVLGFGLWLITLLAVLLKREII
jgi:hypothetical protein